MKRPLAVAIFFGLPGVVSAQNSQVFGRVTDVSDAVMPGVTVTLSSPALLEPRNAVTSLTGTYEFAGTADSELLGQVRAGRLRNRRSATACSFRRGSAHKSTWNYRSRPFRKA